MATQETFEQIKKRVEARRYIFWYSEKHAEHYRRINEFERDEDEKICKNFCLINGKMIPYTACRTDLNASEPYDGALQKFPDYVKVGEGTLKDMRRDGNW